MTLFQNEAFQPNDPAVTSETSTSGSGAPGDIFATTHWSVVLAAASRGRTPQSAQALDELCRAYWYPLYVYTRRRGCSREDAEDLTQSFFASLLARNDLERLDAERGRFRAFLLAALKHFMSNEWDRARAKKRGGGEAPLSLDWETADSRFQIADASAPNPELEYDREWAVALLEQVIERLRAECRAAGKADLFDRFRAFLIPGGAERGEAARELGMDAGTVRVTVHRLRKRYRELLRQEIEKTLSEPAMVEEELRTLFGAFA